MRLAHLHARLKAAPPDARTIDVAFELGFTHLSRMAGGLPAEIRRNAVGDAAAAALNGSKRDHLTH